VLGRLLSDEPDARATAQTGRYRRRMPELMAPTTRLHAAWLEARDEWGPGLHEDGFGLRPFDEVDSATGFAAFVARLTDESDPAKPVEAVWAHCTYRWIVEGGRVLGGIALRHELNDFVLRAGHIGYGIRPAHAGAGWPPGRWAGCSTRRGTSAWTGY
jgi:predicted acetyltransferase